MYETPSKLQRQRNLKQNMKSLAHLRDGLDITFYTGSKDLHSPPKLLRLANVKSRNKISTVFLHFAHWLTHAIICLCRTLSLDIEHSDNVQKNHVPACQMPKALTTNLFSPGLKGWCGRQVLSVEELER